RFAAGFSVRSGADVSWWTALVTIGPSPTAEDAELDLPPEADLTPAGAARLWPGEFLLPPVETVATTAAAAATKRIKTPATRGVTERVNLVSMPFLVRRYRFRGRGRMSRNAVPGRSFYFQLIDQPPAQGIRPAGGCP